jgi:Cellulose biosynthesis protein BcsS
MLFSGRDIWRNGAFAHGGFIIAPSGLDQDGRHGRLGVHVTSMKTEDTEWSAAAGWARDSSGRSSPYVRLSILRRR